MKRPAATKNWERGAVLVTLLLGMVLRAIDLTRGYWLDEIANVGIVSRPGFGALFDIPITVARSPLFFGLYRPWLALLGDGELAARWFALVCGLLGIALLYRLGSDWFGPRVGLGAALLLALNPLHIWYSGDASFYTLVTALALLTVILCQRTFGFPPSSPHIASARPSPQGVILYGAGAGLLLAASVWGTTLLVVQAVLVLARRRHLAAYLAGLLVGLLVSAPALRLYVQGLMAGWSTPTTRSSLPLVQTGYAVLTLAWGFAADPPPEVLQRTLATGGSAQGIVLGQGVWLLLAVGGLPVLLLAGALRSTRRRDGFTLHSLYLALWLALPLVAVDVVTWWAQTNFNVRYVLFALPALLLWVARGRPMVVAAALALTVLFLWRGMSDAAYAREDLRTPLRFLQQAAGSNDVLILAAPEVYLAAPIAFYGPVTATTVVYNAQVATRTTAAGFVAAATAGRCRVWLWSARAWLVDPGDVLPEALAASSAAARATWHWPGSDVSVWQLRPCQRP